MIGAPSIWVVRLLIRSDLSIELPRMLHLRLVVPDYLKSQVLELLEESSDVINLWQIPGAASKPPGDLVSFDVAKEDASPLIQELRNMGLEQYGTIAVEDIDLSISHAARLAEREAEGQPGDAVVWEEVAGRVADSATLSISYLVLITIAMMIAAIGLLTDSILMIIGAMVVGPEFGPLAGVSVALVEGRRQLAGRSLTALAVGFPLGIAAAALLTLLLRGVGVAPEIFLTAHHQLTALVSNPSWYSTIVAVLAGVVGMLAVAGEKSGVLVGVLVSVTTIPAAAYVAVSATYGVWDATGRALVILVINLTAIIVSGVTVLWILRQARSRRLARRHRRETMSKGKPEVGSD